MRSQNRAIYYDCFSHPKSFCFAFLILMLLTVFPNGANAQNGEFDNLLLSGSPGVTYISMSRQAGAIDFIASFSNSMEFYVVDDYSFKIRSGAPTNALVLDTLGVGIGVNPLHALHIEANGANFPEARVVVENDLPTTANRTMFQLINNGGSRFNFVDTSLGTSWVFSSNGSGDFSVSLNGTGGSELKIQRNGRVFMGPGGAERFDLRPNGNLYIDGTLTESSDRNKKQDIESLDAQRILEKVNSMPVTEWSYKTAPNSRHIGPMAQDFHQAFGLGEDNLHVSPRDIASVSLVAIQAQQKQIELQKEKIHSQESEIDLLKRRLERLESVIDKGKK